MEFERNGFRLFYTKTGDGPENLLLFHGFGQNRAVFDPLITHIRSRFTCFSFDLFFHGEDTDTAYTKPLASEVWAGFLRAFLERERINRFSMVAFSIGAKLLVSSVPYFAARIDQLFFIAPEGIGRNLWYRLATSTQPGRYFFRQFMRHPRLFSFAASGAEKLGLLPRRVARFAKSLMDSNEKRKRVYDTWMILSKLNVTIADLAKALNEHPVRVVIFLGTKDPVITAEPVMDFVSRLKQPPEVYMIDSSHITMVRTVTESFSQAFTVSDDTPH